MAWKRFISFSLWKQGYVNINSNSCTAPILFLKEFTFSTPIVIFLAFCNLCAVTDGKIFSALAAFSALVATIHIIASGLWLIREKLNMFIWIKPLQPRTFKGAYLFQRTSCSNICLKSVVLNARKYLLPPPWLLVTVLICSFTTVIAAIHSV